MRSASEMRNRCCRSVYFHTNCRMAIEKSMALWRDVRPPSLGQNRRMANTKMNRISGNGTSRTRIMLSHLLGKSRLKRGLPT
jgi:hypothetical protein